jgi:hypothetical protein
MTSEFKARINAEWKKRPLDYRMAIINRRLLDET